MNCPICKTPLATDELEPNLLSMKCRQCDGLWLEYSAYSQWFQAEDTLQQSALATLEVAPEDAKAKLCPDCGRILTRFKVGHDVQFYLDRCGRDGGIWLDRNEWQALKQNDLHRDLHRITSKQWQDALLREERKQHREQFLLERFGESDFAEIRRIKAWLDKHPFKAELQAYLLDTEE